MALHIEAALEEVGESFEEVAVGSPVVLDG
jgi:hypothetical protein